MKTRSPGNEELFTSAIGLGWMGMAEFSGKGDKENTLTNEDLALINDAAPKGAAAGLRYPEPAVWSLNR